jgi:phage-related tail protein
MADGIVVPFPGRPAAVSGTARLQAALADLQRALADQNRALLEWRRTMTDLGAGVAGLGQSLRTYQGHLSHVQCGLGALQGEAKKLERWADEALARRADG